VEMEEAASGLTVEISGEGRDDLPRGEENLVVRAARATFTALGKSPRGLRIRLENEIPLGRGLGSSAAACIGSVVAASRLVGSPLSPDELLRLALPLEGHPDNITPALLGGLTVSGLVEGRVLYRRLPLARALTAVAVIPSFALSTEAARRVLPERIVRADAVFNLTRLGLLIASLVTGEMADLRLAVEDKLHQPYRAPLVPGMEEVMAEGYRAGALACFLSGAGPTLLALVRSGGEEVGRRMASLWREKFQVECRPRLLGVDTGGACVEGSS